jgi:hypothetical protein
MKRDVMLTSQGSFPRAFQPKEAKIPIDVQQSESSGCKLRAKIGTKLCRTVYQCE